ncbi:MAG: MBL fold metallo-hydrolase [Acetobacteraceae bacterium]|nr:MBL fold metallo-hydrolase [Acetobacteraceae bacterium]
MPLNFTVGDTSIHRIVEQVIPFQAPREFLPTLTAEILEANRGWMEPVDLDPATGKLMLTIQSYVVRTPDFTVLVDSCVGNDKTNPRFPAWHGRTDGSYLAALAAAGVALEDIDYVMCTHMHVDHVGWNTRLVDGRWVPTFPRARYVFAAREHAHWQALHAQSPVPVYAESVLPVIEAGRAEIVADTHAIGDFLRLTPTPGHTPGHVALELGRGRCEAVFTGDLIHTRLQARYPELSMSADSDPVRSAVTRRAFLEQHCDSDTLCCTAHFPAPSTMRVRRWGEGFRCEMVEA